MGWGYTTLLPTICLAARCLDVQPASQDGARPLDGVVVSPPDAATPASVIAATGDELSFLEYRDEEHVFILAYLNPSKIILLWRLPTSPYTTYCMDKYILI